MWHFYSWPQQEPALPAVSSCESNPCPCLSPRSTMKYSWCKDIPTHTLTQTPSHTHTVVFTQRCILHPRVRSSCPCTQDVVSLWVNTTADTLVFFFPPSFSPGLQCQSWPSPLSGQTMGSGYSVIYIHTAMVQHVFFRPVPVCYLTENMLAILLPLSLLQSVSLSPFFSSSYRRVCVCCKLRWQLGIVAQLRWVSP